MISQTLIVKLRVFINTFEGCSINTSMQSKGGGFHNEYQDSMKMQYLLNAKRSLVDSVETIDLNQEIVAVMSHLNKE